MAISKSHTVVETEPFTGTFNHWDTSTCLTKSKYKQDAYGHALAYSFEQILQVEYKNMQLIGKKKA